MSSLRSESEFGSHLPDQIRPSVCAECLRGVQDAYRRNQCQPAMIASPATASTSWCLLATAVSARESWDGPLLSYYWGVSVVGTLQEAHLPPRDHRDDFCNTIKSKNETGPMVARAAALRINFDADGQLLPVETRFRSSSKCCAAHLLLSPASHQFCPLVTSEVQEESLYNASWLASPAPSHRFCAFPLTIEAIVWQ